MNNTKRLLCLLFFSLPFLVNSQAIATNHLQAASNTGIKWTEGLTWEQVKEKAKSENKYIFLDIYTTWCGPCKLMDKDVYVNQIVGGYFNPKFISVKVQADKTKKDNEHIKNWYNDAEQINKQYRIAGYPSFIFLSPQGTIVDKQMGYKSAEELIAMAQTAIRPGKVYDDPYAEYESLISNYKQGIKRYDRMPFMITTAINLGETNFGHSLLKEYTNYCLTLPPEKRYTKDNLEMWNGLLLSSKSRAFQFFYRDGKLIDKVINKKGFAQDWICRTIEDEIVWPFLKEQSGNNPNMGPGMVLTGAGLKVDTREADWKKLSKIIRKKYDANYARKNVLDARIEWYMRNNNRATMAKYQLIKFKKYPPDLKEASHTINSVAWATFLYCADKKTINKAISWQKKVIDLSPKVAEWLDTYANLLYKADKRKEAIQWEEKAVNVANAQNRPATKEKYQEIVNKMKRGEPTY